MIIDIFRRNQRAFWLWSLRVVTVVVIIVSTYFITSAYDSALFRVVYSLDRRQNDKELVHIIDSASHYVYFAIYYFTESDIADALIRAKKRGLLVQGITDATASLDSNKKIISELRAAGIPVETQKHEDGIMHIKALVTDKAYASGSYNWTASATEANDEVLEIGTMSSVREQYLSIIKKILIKNSGGENDILPSVQTKPSKNIPLYDYISAPDHIGEMAIVSGTVYRATTAKSGVTFLDFCQNFSKCPFSVVIFASDRNKFSDLNKYERRVKVTGVIKSYQGRAEMILDSPDQIQ